MDDSLISTMSINDMLRMSNSHIVTMSNEDINAVKNAVIGGLTAGLGPELEAAFNGSPETKALAIRFTEALLIMKFT